MILHRALRRRWFLALAALSGALVACARPEPAQPPAGAAATADSSELEDRIDALDSLVRQALGPAGDIHIQLTGRDSNARLHTISRKVKGVCRNASGDCENGVAWRLIGANRLLSSWQVKIEQRQAGVTKTGCFKPEYVLSAADDYEESGPPAESCQNPGDLWLYDVTLYDADGKQVGDPIDPLLVMYY